MIGKLLLSMLMALQLVLIPQSAVAMNSNTFENRIRYQINQHREPDVRYGRCLDKYAEEWARHLKQTGQLKRRNLKPMIKDCNLSAAGEVLARYYRTPRATVRAWLRSDPHRVVIKNKRYRRVGVGAVRAYRGWIVVVNFGRH